MWLSKQKCNFAFLGGQSDSGWEKKIRTNFEIRFIINYVVGGYAYNNNFYFDLYKSFQSAGEL